jgi:hypothetical protein
MQEAEARLVHIPVAPTVSKLRNVSAANQQAEENYHDAEDQQFGRTIASIGRKAEPALNKIHYCLHGG